MLRYLFDDVVRFIGMICFRLARRVTGHPAFKFGGSKLVGMLRSLISIPRNAFVPTRICSPFNAVRWCLSLFQTTPLCKLPQGTQPSLAYVKRRATTKTKIRRNILKFLISQLQSERLFTTEFFTIQDLLGYGEPFFVVTSFMQVPTLAPPSLLQEPLS